LKQLVYIATLCLFTNSFAQNNEAITEIIDKIYQLEKNKDAKCYATANRLEDFMYGTPLTEDARNAKIEIQKKIVFYFKEKGSEIARQQQQSTISPEIVKTLIDKLSRFEINKNGNYIYFLTTGDVFIKKIDFDQYSSVSYGYRSILSVEQDLFYIPEKETLPLNSEALELVNNYVNLMTLVVLKVSDLKTRKTNQKSITKDLLINSWVLILNESKNSDTPETITYPPLTETIIPNTNNSLTKAIISQKLASYKKYNDVNEALFLRNIQVYFAKQKWPKEIQVSNDLRTYYLESLIQFTKTLLTQASSISVKKNHPLIRPEDIETSLHNFLPSSTNSFEDVTFFPNHLSEKITLESYDLDSFRDSGFHWTILGYALDDLTNDTIADLDPNAAEITVEGIAQLGVLALRIGGEMSKNKGEEVLTKESLTQGFQKIQHLISTYDFSAKVSDKTTIASAKTVSNFTPFKEITALAMIDFEHKSSDWLNRHIRGYTTAIDEGKIKLAIPPAFGGSGVASEDINNDGFIDILLLGGFGNKLYFGKGDKTFTDATKESNLNMWNDSLQSFGEPRQPIIADFNNDGLQDIFITYVNEIHRMYKNSDGISFEDVSTDSGLGGAHLVAGPATAFDYDNDGLLDIMIGYFGNYIKGTFPTLSRDNQNGSPNRLFKNLGNFKFKEVEFTDNLKGNNGWTQALGHTDINQDGWQDVIEGNDFGINKYYLNNGDGSFTEAGKKLGTDKPSYTMNVGITDLNRDLFPDLYISNIVVMQKDEKYVSPSAETTMKFDPKKMANIRTVEANDLFISNSENNGLINYSISQQIGRGYDATGWSWDADFFDFDNDGDEDLYCVNGMNDFSVYSSENPFYFENSSVESKNIAYAQSSKERNVFFVNENGQLLNKAEELGTDLNSNSRSASYLDIDNDGDLDIILNNYHEKAVLYENLSNNANNWIKIKLVGDPNQHVNRDAIGSTIIVSSENLKNIWREIHSTTGYLSVHPKQQHFGLGTDLEADVTVKWSNGTIIKLKNLVVNSSYVIQYPDKILKN
jgi:hypothetical protein